MTDTSELEIIENSAPFQHEQIKIRRGTINQASSTERMISACAGALVTSTLSTFFNLLFYIYIYIYILIIIYLIVTPLDVVKTRLQSQEAHGYRHLNGTAVSYLSF